MTVFRSRAPFKYRGWVTEGAFPSFSIRAHHTNASSHRQAGSIDYFQVSKSEPMPPSSRSKRSEQREQDQEEQEQRQGPEAVQTSESEARRESESRKAALTHALTRLSRN